LFQPLEKAKYQNDKVKNDWQLETKTNISFSHSHHSAPELQFMNFICVKQKQLSSERIESNSKITLV